MSRWSRFLALLITLALALPAAAGAAPPGGKSPPNTAVLLAPGQAKKAVHDEAILEAGPAAVSDPTTVTLSSLQLRDLPPLDQGMVNVTRGPRSGYRFLPHMHFQDTLKVTLPYDKALIPPGYSEADIRTFYFDEEADAWRELERDTLNADAQSVTSLTDHFTDMINAVVTAPDSPGLGTENPNAMSDVQPAHPGDGISLVEPPGSSNTGDALLTYPLELPPGRAGMEPDLNLQYSSAGGNGWLGMGWDLPIPAITVETRWGVPRYAAATETESYLLDGASLTPDAHRSVPEARTAEKRFTPRVEGSFQRIIRHGDSPSTYWWEVTGLNGTRYFYGDNPAPGAPRGTHTLRDGAGHIYRWALREVRDLNDNGIAYTYDRVTHTGVASGTVPGVQLYPRSINYTRSGGEPGPYTVTFYGSRDLADDPQRSDVIIDARGGFKMVTGDLLRRVAVTIGGQLIRQYDLEYGQSATGKSLLTAVTQRGDDGSAFHTHRFDYHSEALGFGAPESWTVGSDNVAGPVAEIEGASAISGAVTTGGGGHIYIGFNPESPTKANSAGGKVGFSYSENEGVLELVDLNGDRLPDKVFKSGDTLYYRPNRTVPGGSAEFGPPQAIATLPAISAEQSFMISGGAEAYPGAVSLFLNQAETFTIGSTYFADVNADGLMDLVAYGQVYFNALGPDGTPTFGLDSSVTPVPVGGGAVDTAATIPDFEQIYQKQLDASPLHDTLRRWIAPFDGTIRISGSPALIQDTTDARSRYKTADGVRVAIQQNGSELWSATIAADDYSPKAPAGVDGIAVRAGDRIYFRIQSVFDGAYDQVAWDPEIAYVGTAPATDVNGLSLSRYQTSADFVLAGRPDIGIQMPYNGTVHLTGRLQKTGVTTDDVTMLVLRNGTPVLTRPLPWNASDDVTLAEDLTVAKGDTLQLQLQVDSPIDVSALSWTPVLYYTATPDVDSQNNPIRVQDQNGNYLIRVSPPYDVNLYPVSGLIAPQTAWTAPKTGTVTVAPAVSASILANGTLTFTVKKPGALVAKRSLQVTAGSVSGAGAFAFDVTEGDRFYFDFSSADPKLTENLLSTGVTARYSDEEDSFSLPSALHSAAAQGLFPQPYRGWSYAGYNGNRDRATRPVDESLLVLDAGDYQSECDPSALTTNEALANSPCRPEQAMAYAFAPNPEQNAWGGPARNGWVKAATASSSRLGAPYVSVPRPGQFAGARAVTRISLTSETSAGAGLGPLSGSYAGDPLDGESISLVDFLDLNGDSFPDIVGNGTVQYTTPDGGLESSGQSAAGLSEVRSSRNYAFNVGVGGSPAYFKAGSGGKVDADGSSAPKGGKNGSSQMVELGLSGELGGGSSHVTADLVDVNGDGLPDRVSRDGSQLTVALNLGYSFAPAEPWGDTAIGDGATRSFSVGGTLGFNAGDYSFAGGLSLAKNESRAGCTLVDPFSGDCPDGQVLLDVNGDGLPDRVTPAGSHWQVAFNTGAGFGPALYWGGALDDAVGIDSDLNFGGGAYFTIGIGPLCIEACYLIINPGFDVSQSMSRQELALLDVDGDGYPDHISSTGDGSLRVARSLLGKANLLKRVSRPLGGSFTLDYERAENTYADPNPHWVLSRVTTSDGYAADGGDTRVTTYRYEGGYYSRLEREFYGFSRVVEEQRNPAEGNALYRSVVRTYANDSYYSRGLLLTERLEDRAGRPYIETANTYAFRNVATGSEVHDLQGATAAIYPEMVRTDQRYFEGQAAAVKSTYVTYARDSLGRTTEMVQSGDVGAYDDLRLSLAYAACPATYLYDEPTLVIMTDDAGNELRRREATVDCATGDQLQVRESIDGTSAAVTDLAYFDNGNLRLVTQPENKQGQRYQLTYEYDLVTATHVTAVSDSFGYRSENTYNLKFGALESSTDINGNRTSYTFDAYGRIVAVTGPYQQESGTPTIQFEYHHDAAVPWALTRRTDTFRSATDPIDTVVFADGEGRVIQTKDDAALHVSPDELPQDVMIVSGWTIHDLVGRTVAEYYPVTEPMGTPGLLNETFDAVTPTRTVYDVRDRITSVTLPDGAVTSYAYGFGTDRAGVLRFELTETDPNGIVKQQYRDAARRVTSVKQFNQGGTETIWTSYDYDPLGQLIRVTDDQGNVTAAAYDRLGRRIRVDSPDAGLTEYRYDPASNLIAEVTPTLRDGGGAITYRYDFNRLTDILHPTYPDTDVHYTYGAPGAPENQAGRITRTVDQSGSEEFAYGRLGEVTRTVKTVASDTQGNSPNSPEVYTTQFLYDTFGRLQTLTYPDGEVLTYRYDSGGRLQSADGVKAGQTYSYIRRDEYDKFGEAVFQEAGNHIRTRYEYHPQSRYLSRLKAGKGEGNLFQNLAYTYNLAGNVLTAANQVPVPPASQFGGPSTQQFSYDDLYRLTSATGTYQYNPDKARRYSLNLTYDSISNITAKAQTDETVQPSGTAVPEGKTSYTQAYTFGGVQPHAPVQIGDRAFRYDAAGNGLGWDDLTSGTRQTILWDDEYRIRSIFENGQELTYKYNDQGDRVIKRGPQGETVYVNQYFTIRNRTVATKHIWAGDTRLASKLVKQPRNATGETDGDGPLEKDLYFYHADRAGNSGYVTDARGKLYEHTEYFPFGEVWVQEKSNTQRTPYLFAGKELDEETGLYYYGARYYDPQTSLWQSTDPILGDYLNGRPGGGVYNPANLQLYGYADQNPITYTDPNGEAVYRVPYFSSAYSKWARDKRKLKSYGGRNLATLAYLEADGVTRGYKTKASDGYHSEKRLYDWFQANCAGCTVRWLYTELAPCGSDVHNCSNRVQNWWSGIDVYYSIEYPNHDDVNATSTQTGANRTLTQRLDIAQERRARAVKVLKMFGREVRRRHLKGLAMAGKHKFRKGSTNYVDESDVEMGISNK